MDDSIQASFRYQFIFEQAVPVRDRQLTGNDKGLFVVPVIKDLLEVILELSLNGFHSKVIEDNEVVPGQFFEEPEFFSFQPGHPHLVREALHGEVNDLLALPAGLFAQGICKIGFAGTSRTADNDGATLADIFAGTQLGNEIRGHATGGVNVQFLDGGCKPEAGALDEFGNAIGLPAVHLRL